MPSYQFDQYHYRIHKAKGGTLANYQDRTLQHDYVDVKKGFILWKDQLQSRLV